MRRVTDEDGYRQKERRQSRPGIYHVSASRLLPNTRAIIPNDTRIRSQITGSIESPTVPPISQESDLRGLGKPVNRAPANYIQTHHSVPTQKSGHHTAQEYSPQSMNVRVRDIPHLRTLDSRLDMPALALRGATPNRFHPLLLQNPTDFSFAPFDRLVSSRIVMKDQWRPPMSSLTSVRPPTIPAHIQQKPAY
jgi:hypothetical protein